MSHSDFAPDPLFDLSKKVFIVAGGSGGLGKGLVQALYERGARLAVCDLDEKSLATLSQSFSGILTAVADICDEASMDQIVQQTLTQFGRLDGGINAAGIIRPAAAFELDVDALRMSFEVNVVGAFNFSRAIARRLPKAGGRIVHIASVSSTVANVGYAAYASSKSALSHMVRVLAREWASSNILVNAIGPSMFNAGMAVNAVADPTVSQQALSVIPMGRFGQPEDLSGMAITLLSQAGSYITGQTIYVDGGRTLV
ncbi:2-deoxy-D-gluconate 3-dehydrogenase [Shimia gijangensis]|uniref:2-deoxy-D-gluconate 3-dehydrogenase n=1 Tax=Shimia gijangensis TaxID=1470563 RepID=A0A1M6T7C4_9RHOB|nr:SDR family oxidoreductase [Shimia gijangensis]SHK52887.1 2-deoxy-D-gluconate 3-dehydrogenase [Shimia gijangensis]